MATTWAAPANDPIEGGGDLRHDEKVERERAKWRLVHSTNSTTQIRENIRGVTAPEDLHMLPQDLDFLPQEVNAASMNDYDDVAAPSTTWTTVADPT